VKAANASEEIYELESHRRTLNPATDKGDSSAKATRKRAGKISKFEKEFPQGKRRGFSAISLRYKNHRGHATDRVARHFFDVVGISTAKFSYR
jgi:hypothetical protein